MNKIKRFSSLILALVMVLTVALPLASCNDDPAESTPEETTPQTPNNVNYTVSVKTAGGLVMDGLMVYIYNKDQYIVGKASTDVNGVATFSLPASTEYTIELSGVPAGYILQERYDMGPTGANIVLVSKVVDNPALTFESAKLGDIMKDFKVTDTNGNVITLSELLKTKKAVMINFWFIECQYCVEEFPALNNAYNKYKDDIEVVALNVNGDSMTAIKDFKDRFGSYHKYYYPSSELTDDYKLDFPMVSDIGIATGAFGLTGAPVSVMIDRYGMISLMHIGAVNERQFENMFAHYTSDDYRQATYSDVTQLVPVVKPNVEMPSTEELSAALNQGSIDVTYTPELEAADKEYSWPFKITEKNGETCIFPANSGLENSFATLHAKVELKKGQAFVFDYLASTADIFYLLVDGDDVYQITGNENKWKECCPWVADEDGTYDVVFLYNKGDGAKVGDDGVYLKDFRVVKSSEVNAASYIPREAATHPTDDGTDYKNYISVVLNPDDGYYHVGTKDGPILLARLIYNTRFSSTSVTENLYANEVEGFIVDGKNCFDAFNKYCNYSANSKLYTYCSVTEELAGFLKEYVKKYGFNTNENTWLQLCSYYDVYGKNEDGSPVDQLEDPIKGLSTHSAYIAHVGTSNKVTYDGSSMIPRGYLYKFVPEVSGAYRITSKNTDQELIGWVFSGNDADWTANGDRILYRESDTGERICEDLLIKDKDGNITYDSYNVSMAAYFEAGKEYYIDIAFSDIYGVGSFMFDIKYIGPTFDYFIMASPGPFTFELDPSGNAGNTITDGIDVMLGNDGYYYHKKADGTQGSMLYADFLMTTSIFTSESLQNMVDKGAFNFKLSELDHIAIAAWESADKNEDKLREKWGDDFKKYWELYKMDDIIKGRYHGTGEDLTEEFRSYVSKMLDEKDYPERQGCVKVDERLAQILQLLMDKYTFENVENSFIKLCYYYDYLGK